MYKCVDDILGKTVARCFLFTSSNLTEDINLGNGCTLDKTTFSNIVSQSIFMFKMIKVSQI